MRRLYLLVMMGLILSCDNQKTISQQDKIVEYFDNGSIRKEVALTDGIMNGLYVEYYENGAVKSKGLYEEDELEGEVIHYYDDGSIMEKQVYEGGVKRYFEKFDKKGNITARGALPVLHLKDSSSPDSALVMVVDMQNYLYDSVQLIIGNYDYVNNILVDTTRIVKCEGGICEYTIENYSEGTNTVSGVILDVLYEDKEVEFIYSVPIKYEFEIDLIK